MPKCFSLLLAVLLSATAVFAAEKKFTDYYRLVNQAEAAFVEKNFQKCFRSYDVAFQQVDKPYVSDCYIAAQFAFLQNDTAHYLHYLQLAFDNGMPLSAYGSALIFRKQETNPAHFQVVKELFAKRKQYSIDTNLVDQIYLMGYRNDSLIKYMNEDSAMILAHVAQEELMRSFVTENFLLKGQFPNEKNLGIMSPKVRTDFRAKFQKVNLFPPEDEQAMLAAFGAQISDMVLDSVANKEEYELRNSTVLCTFIHYTCTWKEYKELLWQAVLNGYLSPRDYGFLHETSAIWNREGLSHRLNKICDYPTPKAYYNINGFSPNYRLQSFVKTPDLLLEVDKNREQIMMQNYSVDLEKRRLEKDFGLRLFYGFGT